MHDEPVSFSYLNQQALAQARVILCRWLPEGVRQGNEWIARNPKRFDKNLGSFRINMKTGKWADFATGDKGGDIISLAAYLFDLKQIQAARNIQHMLF